MMATLEVSAEDAPLIRREILRERDRYRRRDFSDVVRERPDLKAEVEVGEMARESLAIQAEEVEGPALIEGDPAILSEVVGEVLVDLCDRLDPIADGLEDVGRKALRIAYLVAEVQRLDREARAN